MDELEARALRILRDRDFSMLEDKDQADVLSLFLDDNEKPSKNGRYILAISAAMLGMNTGRRKLENKSRSNILVRYDSHRSDFIYYDDMNGKFNWSP